MASNIFNDYFNQLQSAIRSDDAEKVMSILASAGNKVLEESPKGQIRPLIYGEFAHLLLGCHTDLYPNDKGYRTYERSQKIIPIYYLANKNERLKERGFLLLDSVHKILDQRMEEEIRREAEERTKKDLEHMLERGYRQAEGTPFGKNWKITPPSKER